MSGMAITTTSIAHIRLTVTDIERSREFYESVFGWRVLFELPEGADAATRDALSYRAGVDRPEVTVPQRIKSVCA